MLNEIIFLFRNFEVVAYSNVRNLYGKKSPWTVQLCFHVFNNSNSAVRNFPSEGNMVLIIYTGILSKRSIG